MKVVGFITEYNPFHYGHKYHLENSKELTNSTHSIAVMSGSFVQRGEPSLIDKWTKAKMAIDCGVDLVIELPFIYSVQSAELFSFGGISILDSLKVVDTIAFGSELGELSPLENIANVLNEEPEKYKDFLRTSLDKGLSYSAARSAAIEKYFNYIELEDNYSYKEILKMSNNILGIEYIKALKKLNSTIKPVAIKRLGNNYNDIQITSSFASATGIRNKLQLEGIESIKNLMPPESFYHIKEFYYKYDGFNYLENYNNLFQYIFRISNKDYLKEFMDMENGLENRIISKGALYSDINKIIDEISTKRYPITRIKRILIHLLSNLTKPIVNRAYNITPSYIRVLGSNQKGLEILNRIKQESDIEIITKFADHKAIKNEYINFMLSYEELATNLYFLGLNKEIPSVNFDYLKSPYIK